MRESNRLHDNCTYPDELIYKSTICGSVIYIQYSPCRQIHSINTSTDVATNGLAQEVLAAGSGFTRRRRQERQHWV